MHFILRVGLAVLPQWQLFRKAVSFGTEFRRGVSTRPATFQQSVSQTNQLSAYRKIVQLV